MVFLLMEPYGRYKHQAVANITLKRLSIVKGSHARIYFRSRDKLLFEISLNRRNRIAKINLNLSLRDATTFSIAGDATVSLMYYVHRPDEDNATKDEGFYDMVTGVYMPETTENTDGDSGAEM